MARLGEQDRELQRKEMLAVHVLMQAIVVAGAIAQEERRRPCLTRLMAAREERFVLGGIANGDAHRFVPPVRERLRAANKSRVEARRSAQAADRRNICTRLGQSRGSPSRCASESASRRDRALQARGRSRTKAASARPRSHRRRARARSSGQSSVSRPSSGPLSRATFSPREKGCAPLPVAPLPSGREGLG